MTFPGVETGQIEHGTAGGTLHHITTTSGAVQTRVPGLANAGEPSSGARVEHKFPSGFRVRREEAAPGPVVPPATGRRAQLGVEAQPPLHVCFGNPHPLMAVILGEDHQVRHSTSLRRGSK
jgi:hypothetical protein